MDIVDRAQENEATFKAACLSSIRHYSGDSEKVCSRCGEPIPEARQKAIPGVTLCVDCQTELDES
jgi:phage/conjugal plasmid C-4 type zinc finger TraR family protein